MTTTNRTDGGLCARVLDELDEGICVVDADHRIMLVNEALQDLLHIREEEVEGRDVSDVFRTYLAPVLEVGDVGEIVDTIRGTRNGSQILCRMQTSAGAGRWFSVVNKPPRNGFQVVKFRDVTDSENARTIQTALQPSPVVVFAQDTDLCYTWTYNWQIGLSPEMIIGRTDADLFYPEDAAWLTALKRRVLETGEGIRTEVEITVGGTACVYDLALTPLKNDRGTIVGITGASFDITERKRAEMALQESEQRYRSIFTESRAVMLLVDPKTGEIVDANPAACTYYGYPYDQITRMKITDINMLSPRETCVEMQKAKRGEKEHFIFQHRLANGSIRTVEVYSGSVTIGGRILLHSIIHDITRQRRMEAALRRTGERFKRIFNESPIGIQYYSANGRLIHVNRACLDIFGIPDARDLRGYNIFKDSTIPERLKEPLQRGEGGHATIPVDLDLVKERNIYPTTKTGTVYVDAYASPLRDRDTGSFRGFLVQILEVTDRAVMEELRKQAYHRIEQNMEQFAILGDHVRHPLQVILARADLMEEEETAEKIREQVRRIDGYIRQLDQGWIESRKIREFLRRNDLA
jgi:PAS domain S-box-containing protein